MTEPEPNLSRTNRKKNRKWSNNLLNILIAVVVVLIIIFSATILGGGKDNEKASEEEILPSEEATANKKDEKVDAKDEILKESNNVEGSSEKKADNSDEEVEAEKSGVVTYVSSEDGLIAETIINTAWEPIGTEQRGDHVSLYDGKSDDWNEKKEALAYATGLSVDSMIFKKIKNGGSPQESIGIVSSSDGAEKYRVYLQWVDEKGWKPVKMDVLTSLNFDY